MKREFLTKLLPDTDNLMGYSLEDYFEAIKATCAVYKVEVIDVYGESEINTTDPKYKS